jgi:long-subunit fatty acid transport protein
MKFTGFAAGTALLLTTTSAMALGLDRSGQDISAMFEQGGYAELTYGNTTPDITGVDVLGNQISNVGETYGQVALSFKMDINDQVSLGLIVDEPYGANISYGGSPVTTMLGGTGAELNSRAFTAIGRYAFSDQFSVHAGVRYQTLDGEITLAGNAFGGFGAAGSLNGYNLEMSDGSGTGYLVGAAYEVPDIMLRVALTYFSAIENEFDTSESLNGVALLDSTTTVDSPEAINLDFQSGVAANTLVFGQIRYAKYSQTILSPDAFAGATGGGSITDIEDSTSYMIGVGRRFSDAFSGSVSVGFEPASDDDLVSPLAPTNGQSWITVGGQYTMDNIVFSGGVRYTMLGDAFAETGTPDVARATFADNSAVSIGLGVAYRF